jgi:hypothetical protein
MLRSLSTWLYDGDPFEVVAFESPLSAIKESLARGDTLFEDLISTYLLENPHQVQVVLEPDKKLGALIEAREAERLAAVKKAMTPEEIQEVMDRTARLKEIQAKPDAPEDLATIPFLTRDELDPLIKTVPLEEEALQGTRVLFHDLETNGIVYVDLVLDLHHMVQKYLPYVPLFGRALLEMGTDTEDYVEFGKRIRRKTGGMGASPFTASVLGERDGFCKLILRGKAMAENVGELMGIARDALLRVNLGNKERFRQIVVEEKAGLEQALIPSGHALATLRVRSRFNEADWAQEQMGGVSYLFFLRFLLDKIETDWETVEGSLREIQYALVDAASMVLNVTASATVWAGVRAEVEAFLGEMPERGLSTNTWLPVCSQDNEGLTIPAMVNYVAKAADLYAGGYTYHGSVNVITKYLRTSWLWEQVRVLGGAYGGFCGFDRQSGLMTFGSYRDPNILSTLEAFDKTADFLATATLDQSEIDKGVIGAIGGMDQYQLPDAKGFSSMIRFLTGVSDTERQTIRDQILATDKEHFRAFGQVLAKCVQRGFVSVLGSAEDIEQAREKAGLTEVFEVL